MNWILVIMMYGNGVAVSTADFKSEESCKAAQASLTKYGPAGMVIGCYKK